MRKLCHPQPGAVAHVLSGSPKLEISDDKTLVRPLLHPPSSPAHSGVNQAEERAHVLTVAERVMGDANLVYDRALHAALAADSPAEALKPGGKGARLRLQTFLKLPQLRHVDGL
eukprot:7085103-Prymnesium_polylepis.1